MGRAAVRETLTMAADGERRPTSPRWGRKAHGVSPPVFLASAIIILAVAAFAVTQRETANAVFPALLHGVTTRFGWFYLLAVAGFLSFVGWLAVSPFGRIRLGADDSTPEFGQLPWFAMLFSAGMGIGLVFFGVAEPISHYVAPPSGGPGGTTEAARRAMIVTFFHWGVHAWAIYAVAGLALAYFAFRRGLPLSIRSALFPLIGARIHGPIGHAIDVFAVISTLFGVATSLGLGVMQVNAGLSHLFGAPMSLPVQLWLIAGITAIATLSVVTGLDRGIRRISELNLGLAFALLLFVLATGPTLHLLNAFTQNLGAYLSDFVRLTFRNFAYEPNEWIASWTLFYWGWWIAWAPFVGMFIARISRGRTIREFILGVLLAPAGFTFIWLTVFGNTALWLERTGAAPLAETVQTNLPVALFVLLEQLPLGGITAALATLLVVTFFVTSSDSGSLVIDMMTSGGDPDPPLWTRVFWALTEGVVAAALLVAGGLTALQAASLTSALPFTAIMILICIGLWRGLRDEPIRAPAPPGAQAVGAAPPLPR